MKTPIGTRTNSYSLWVGTEVTESCFKSVPCDYLHVLHDSLFVIVSPDIIYWSKLPTTQSATTLTKKYSKRRFHMIIANRNWLSFSVANVLHFTAVIITAQTNQISSHRNSAGELERYSNTSSYLLCCIQARHRELTWMDIIIRNSANSSKTCSLCAAKISAYV